MQETITIYIPGPIAGFPGTAHGPGVFVLDYDARTVTPVLPADQEQLSRQQQPIAEAATIDTSAQGV